MFDHSNLYLFLKALPQPVNKMVKVLQMEPLPRRLIRQIVLQLRLPLLKRRGLNQVQLLARKTELDKILAKMTKKMETTQRRRRSSMPCKD